jgi:hypothetical protein
MAANKLAERSSKRIGNAIIVLKGEVEKQKQEAKIDLPIVTPGNEQYQKPEANGAAQHLSSKNLRSMPFLRLPPERGTSTCCF